MFMTAHQLTPNCISQSYLLSNTKKKYSKVNQTLRQRFLQCIIQHNMSIKEASQTLNINYSSAKAILASHRKKINSRKIETTQGAHANYRTLNQLEDCFLKFSVVCSTGGRQTSRFGGVEKMKQIHKASINPVIVLRMEKEVESSDHTSHGVQN